MKLAATTLITLTILGLPLIGAAPNAQTGSQTGYFWSQGTIVSVQPGTGYVLAGAIGDHDIFFFDSFGYIIGGGIACGADTGAVPLGAAFGLVVVWDHTGQVIPLCLASPPAPPSSTFIYVDGI